MWQFEARMSRFLGYKRDLNRWVVILRKICLYMICYTVYQLKCFWIKQLTPLARVEHQKNVAVYCICVQNWPIRLEIIKFLVDFLKILEIRSYFLRKSTRLSLPIPTKSKYVETGPIRKLSKSYPWSNLCQKFWTLPLRINMLINDN